MERALARHPTMRERVFTPAEIYYCDSKARPAESYAGRFAAREATIKALGGYRGKRWQDISVGRAPTGAPSIVLEGQREAAGRRARHHPGAHHVHPREDQCGRVRDRGAGMKPVLTPAQAVELDRETQGKGVSAESLMERAGRAVARAAAEVAGGVYGRRAAVVCGTGNNGGDGLVAARHLSRRGMRVAVLAVEPLDALREPSATNLARLGEQGLAARACSDGRARTRARACRRRRRRGLRHRFPRRGRRVAGQRPSRR